MKSYEREALLKSFMLYFVTIGLLSAVLLFHGYREDITAQKQQLFLEMKNFSFDFQGDRFGIDFTRSAPQLHLLELRETDAELYALFPLPGESKYVLKVIYDKEAFAALTRPLRYRYLLYMLIVTAVVGTMAYGFARYTLRPLRSALALTDRFIKDIIHDLNTPVSAILINTAMLPRDNAAVQRIEKSAKFIGMLQRNLQEYHGGLPQQRETFRLDILVNERLAFFQSLYPKLRFLEVLEPTEVTANPDALARIIDNLLSNAAKYSVPGSDVSVELSDHTLQIENTPIEPLRSPDKLFDRFYKESERGIGIGLHIVKKLCDEAQIGIAVTQHATRVSFVCTFPEAS